MSELDSTKIYAFFLIPDRYADGQLPSTKSISADVFCRDASKSEMFKIKEIQPEGHKMYKQVNLVNQTGVPHRIIRVKH